MVVGGPSATEIAESRAARREARARAELEGRVELPLPESAIRSDGRPEKRPPRSLGGVVEAVARVVRTSAAAFRYELLAFAICGAWLLRGEVRREREGVVLGSILLYSGVLILLVWGAGYVGRRHALAAWLPAIPFAAVAWMQLFRMLHEKFLAQRVPTDEVTRSRYAIFALIVLLFVVWGPRDFRLRRIDRAPTRAAAEWLAAAHPESGAVAAQKLRTAYYAEASFVPLPPGHDGRLKEQLTRRRTRWIVIDEAKLTDHLGLREGIGSWLNLVHSVSFGGRRVLVLDVSPRSDGPKTSE